MENNHSTDGLKHIVSKRLCPTIGLLCDRLVNEYSVSMWAGVADAAQERGANLIYFSGGVLDPPYESQSVQSNILYDLVSAETLDGLVLWGAQLAHYTDPEAVKVLCEKYRPLPMVSIGLALEDIPSLLVDNYQGMHDIIIHLIEVHGYRRIAFIRGPEANLEAGERYRAYVDALAEYDMSLDLTLVVNERDANQLLQRSRLTDREVGIHILLDERRLRPQVDFDAVVANDDSIALAAMNILQARGFRVPDDVAIAGFDDIEESRYTTPPLTTVRQSFYDLGQQGVEVLLAQLEGDKVPEQVVLPMESAIRQSCGCLAAVVVEAAVEEDTHPSTGIAPGEPFEVAFASRRGEILSEMVQAMGVSPVGVVRERVEQLLDAFAAELEHVQGEKSTNPFLFALNGVLRQVAEAGGDVTIWQGAISALRRQALSCMGSGGASSRVENLWQQARVMIGEIAQRVQAYQALQVQRRVYMLQEVSQLLTTAFDVEKLMDVITHDLPRLGIPSCYLSLYEGEEMPPSTSRLILAYDENGPIELELGGRRFPSHRLAPDGMLPYERASHAHRSCCIAVEPLYFREEQLGFVLFETESREGMVYEALRGQISSALKGALLLLERRQAEDAMQRAYAAVEKQVEEQTVELKREVAERERLQEDIIEAQKQALRELSTPIIPVMDRIIVMPLIGSIDSARARDITRALLVGIRQQRAKVVILDITGVPVVDSGVADHLNKTIQAARLKGAHTIVTGISDAVAEIIVDLGIDWSSIETLSDLQTGLRVALAKMGQRIMG